jgi:hypothetical protein
MSGAKEAVAGSKWAEEVLGTLEGQSGRYVENFWRRMKKELPTQQLDPKAMADEEAKLFGRELCTFGKHNGKNWDDVPLDYIEWLVDQNNKLQRYLRSRRIQEELSG